MNYKVTYKTYSIVPGNEVIIEEHSFVLKSLFKPTYKQIRKKVCKHITDNTNINYALISDVECKREKSTSKK